MGFACIKVNQMLIGYRTVTKPVNIPGRNEPLLLLINEIVQVDKGEFRIFRQVFSQLLKRLLPDNDFPKQLNYPTRVFPIRLVSLESLRLMIPVVWSGCFRPVVQSWVLGIARVLLFGKVYALGLVGPYLALLSVGGFCLLLVALSLVVLLSSFAL